MNQFMLQVQNASPRTVALIEVVIVIVAALLSKWVLSFFIWRYAGPVSLLLIVGLLTLYMRRKGQSWRDCGLVSLRDKRSKLLLLPQMGLAFAAFAAVVTLTTLGGQALGLDFMAEPPSGVEDRWGAIEGSLPMLLLWLAIVWTAAAFGEEMFFRGFLITRLQTALQGLPFASVLAVLLAAILFGYGHFYYQGLRGAIVTGSIALAFGTVFLLFKRNLWPAIFIHGIIDSLGMTAIYLGLE